MKCLICDKETELSRIKNSDWLCRRCIDEKCSICEERWCDYCRAGWKSIRRENEAARSYGGILVMVAVIAAVVAALVLRSLP